MAQSTQQVRRPGMPLSRARHIVASVFHHGRPGYDDEEIADAWAIVEEVDERDASHRRH